MIKDYNPAMLSQRPSVHPTAFNVNSQSLLHGMLPETHGISKSTADFLYNAAQDSSYSHNAAKELDTIVGDTISSHLTSGTNGNPVVDYGNSASSVSYNRAAPSALDYLNAELAQHYGMGRSTAYQEALSNTAYQRAVKDMQAAGLNPAAIFGSGKGYTAGGVSYVDDGSSGSGGSSGSNKKLVSAGLYHGLATAVGLATAALTKNPANYWIGSYATQGVIGALDAMMSR